MPPSQPERRLQPTRTAPLLARVEPEPGELFRSFLARTAHETEIPYYAFLECLGIATGNASPPWLGVTLTSEEASLLASILRHDPDALQALQLPTHQAPSPERVKHPSRYRACAECQTEHGAWTRRNADPIQLVCPTHHTLLHSEGPDQQPLRNDKPFTHPIGWKPLTGQTTTGLGDYVALQELLRHHRTQHPKIDKMFARVLIAYQRAARHAPHSTQLAYITERGQQTLDTHDRRNGIDQQRERVTDTQTIWASVEDTTAIFPAATVFILEAIIENNRSGYNELLEDLRDLAPRKPVNLTSLDTNSTAAIISESNACGPSQLYELDHYYDKWVTQAHLHQMDKHILNAA